MNMGGPLRFSLMLTGWLLLFACGKPVDGCLDIRASNFKAEADHGCCCTYPSLKLRVSHALDTVFHSADSTITNAGGQTCRLVTPFFFLSEFTLYWHGGDASTVTDSVAVTAEDGSRVTVTDDIVWLDRTRSLLTVGTILESGTLDSVAFTLGLPSAVQRIQASAFPSDHTIRSAPATRYDGTEGWATAAATFITPAQGTDTLTWSASPTVRVVLTTDLVTVPGDNLEIPLVMDYTGWFREEDLTGSQSSDPDLWIRRIAASIRYGNL